MLARHLLPDGLSHLVAEADAPVALGLGEENAPAVVGRLHIAELRPALLVDRDGGAQIDVSLVMFSNLESMLSIGYARAFEHGEHSDEFMASLRLLK